MRKVDLIASTVLVLAFFLPSWKGAFALDDQTILIDGPEVDLTVADVKKALLSVPPDIRPALLATQANIQEAINSTYMTKVAAHRARERGLDKDPEVQAAIWNRTQNILAAAELQRVIDETMARDADFEKAAREEYLANQEKYHVPEQVEASHILFRVKNEEDEPAVLEKARQVREDILTGKIAFEDAARKYSEDAGSGAKGGSLGVFTRGKMVKPFEKVAFELEPGEISEPVRTKFGYHLILVKSHKPASVQPFDQVKAKIIEELKKKMEGRIRRDYWFRVEGDERIKVNRDAIEAFLKEPLAR